MTCCCKFKKKINYKIYWLKVINSNLPLLAYSPRVLKRSEKSSSKFFRTHSLNTGRKVLGRFTKQTFIMLFSELQYQKNTEHIFLTVEIFREDVETIGLKNITL